ncbi:hypothetical protein RRG08_015547 [Elysia crispata]|uniref:Uncharacterized protein n=1 Tax=Elysia crispata TaxID=231223 RepID=A0AAE0YIQ6_9GAST|nr:hypothetical protein RRG08_015547 [Elysia crispata]
MRFCLPFISSTGKVGDRVRAINRQRATEQLLTNVAGNLNQLATLLVDWRILGPHPGLLPAQSPVTTRSLTTTTGSVDCGQSQSLCHTL